MGRIDVMHLLVVLCLGMSVGWVCCQDNATAVYIVTLKQAPAAIYNAEFVVKTKPLKQDGKVNTLDKPLPSNISRKGWNNGHNISQYHDSILRKVLKGENYLKLYSYHYLINGFAVLVTPPQIETEGCLVQTIDVVSMREIVGTGATDDYALGGIIARDC